MNYYFYYYYYYYYYYYCEYLTRVAKRAMLCFVNT